MLPQMTGDIQRLRCQLPRRMPIHRTGNFSAVFSLLDGILYPLGRIFSEEVADEHSQNGEQQPADKGMNRRHALQPRLRPNNVGCRSEQRSEERRVEKERRYSV